MRHEIKHDNPAMHSATYLIVYTNPSIGPRIHELFDILPRTSQLTYRLWYIANGTIPSVNVTELDNFEFDHGAAMLVNRLPSADFTPLAKIDELHSIYLQGVVSDQQFEALCKAQKLQSLVMHFDASDKQLKQLSQLKTLTSLKLEGLAFDNECLRYIAEIESLHFLSIQNTSITSEGVIKYLADSQLKGIAYKRQTVSASAILSIKSLENVSLSFAEDTTSFDQLLNLQNLKHLTVAIDNITEEQVNVLSKILSLNSLTLRSPKASQELRFVLANSLPKECYFEP